MNTYIYPCDCAPYGECPKAFVCCADCKPIGKIERDYFDPFRKPAEEEKEEEE